MKELHCFSVVALMWTAACTAASSSGFDIADGQWHLRETRPGTYHMTVTGDRASIGSMVSLRGDSSSARSYGQVEYSVPIPSTTPQRISLSADIRPHNVRDRATIWIRADRAGKPLVTEYAQVPARGTSDWQHQETGFVVPESASAIAYGVLLEGPGEVVTRRFSVESIALPSSATPPSSAAEADLDSALQLARTYALWRDTVNWTRLEARVRRAAAGARETRDVYPAIRLLAASLGDHHSSFYTPADLRVFRSGFNTPAVDVHVLRGNIGYVNSPGYLSEQRDSTAQYVRETYAAVRRVAPASNCGWVIDLRGNSGGTPEPMFAALAPFFDSDNPPQVMPAILRQFGARVPRDLSALSNTNIAVLIGSQTGSAGERLASALRQRPRSRLFGQSTAGVATIRRFDMLPDGAALAIATSAMDRTRSRDSTLSMAPDVVTTERNRAGDVTLKAAADWLVSAGCIPTTR